MFCIRHFAESAFLTPLTERANTQACYNSYATLFGFTAGGEAERCTQGPLFGIATKNSVPDGAVGIQVKSKCMAAAVVEVKGAEASPLAGTREVVAHGTRIVVNMVAMGLETPEVLVPIISIAGRLLQFGAMFALKPCFPVYMPVSAVLDVADDQQARVAAAFLAKASAAAKTTQSKLRKVTQKPKTSMKLELDMSCYHIKILDDSTLERGLGMFGGIDNGLEHMVLVLNKLFASRAREYVVFPLGLRTPDEEKGVNKHDCPMLIFPDLGKEGFRIGTPKFPSEGEGSTLWHQYMNTLDNAVSAIHDAGVIHVDLYPSNIMWRKSSNGLLDLRIIDWDSAHCLDEGDFSESVKVCETPGCRLTFGTAHDLHYIEVIRRLGQEVDSDLCVKLASTDRNAINCAFTQALALYPAVQPGPASRR